LNADHEDPDYRVAADGSIELTPEGRAFYTAYFGYAGIDIRRIKTYEEFHRAERQAFPFLFDFMAQRLKKRPQTLETRALLAVCRSDWDACDRTLRQLKTREHLSLVSPENVAPQSPA